MQFFLPIIFFGWIIIILVYFYSASKNTDPKFCISMERKNYNDGYVDICTGLGYKVYKYNRKDYMAIEIGPFWLKEKK